MSTKIYDMFKYHGSIFELMQWLKKFRRAYEVVAIREVSFMIGACFPPSTGKDYVLWSNGDGKEFHFNYFQLVDLLRDEIKAGLNEQLNIDASAVVYPYGDQVYIQFFGLDFGTRKFSKCLRRHIDSNEKFEDYSYWNNTDQPEGITRAEWEEREKLFDETIFKGHHFFNSSGLTFELSNVESLSNIARHVAIWRENNQAEHEIIFWGEKDVEVLVKNACRNASEYNFQDGYISPLESELKSLISTYGMTAVESLDKLISEINANVAAESLRVIGRIKDTDTYKYRKNILESNLSNESIYIRDGAIVGLLSMDDPASIEAVKKRLDQETSKDIQIDLKQLLDQLTETKMERKDEEVKAH